ncbi:MAG: sugar-binding protein [Armatimonadota bacterium]
MMKYAVPCYLFPLPAMISLVLAFSPAPVTAQRWTTATHTPVSTLWCRWKPAASIKIDGNLDEWKSSDYAIVLDTAHLNESVYYNPEVTGGDKDCSGQIALCWDGRMLYLALKVQDDVLAPIDTAKGYGAPWFHDGLIFYLHAHGGLELTGRYGTEYRRDPKYEQFALLGLSRYQPDYRARDLPGTTRYVTRVVNGGYHLEAAIDLPALGYTEPHAGDRLKLAFILVDQDPGVTGPSGFGQLIWHLGTLGNPRDWAEMVLLRDDWGAEAIAAAQPGAGNTLRLLVKCGIVALRERVTFNGVQLTDRAGKVVQTFTTNTPVEKGKRLHAIADGDTTSLADGVYTVNLLAAVDGQPTTVNNATSVFLKRGAPLPQLPKIATAPNPARYILQKRPPALKNITRDTYLEFLKEHARPVLVANSGGPMKNPWRFSYGYGMLGAYLYAQTKDPFFADVAKIGLESSINWVRSQDKEGAFHTQPHWLMVKFMRESGLLGPADEPRIKEFLITTGRNACKGAYDWDNMPWRRGAGHSSLGPAVARYLTARAYPDIPENAFFRKYFDLTWNDWWQHRDSGYNDTSYRALFLEDIFLTAYLTGEKQEIFTDPEAKKFWERLLYTMAPSGAYPHYGDTNGWCTAIGDYIFFFEYLAAKTRDGRYKYAAHRLFDYMVNHTYDVHDYHFELDTMLKGVMYAHMVADDTVKETPFGPRSRVVTRKELVKLRPDQIKEELGWQIYNMIPGPRDIPDKIIFRSDDRDESFWALIDVCGDAEHNAPGEPTNVAALMDYESVLSCNQGYMDETADLHNVIFAEDLEGTRGTGMEMKISVPAFADWQRASYARVRVENYQGWPLDEERQFFFVRNGFLVLKDRVTFNDTWLCRIGPCWQTQCVNPTYGKNWVDTSVPSLFLTGLGTGGGCLRWKNPPRDLLVYHPTKTDCSLEMVNRFAEQPYRVLPIRLRYAWKGMAEKGQQLYFTTVLLPHAPLPDPRSVADSITVLAETREVTAIRVVLKDRAETVLMNDSGGTVKAGEIETDARLLNLTEFTGKTTRHLLASGGTFVKLNGAIIAQGTKEQDIDKDL